MPFGDLEVNETSFAMAYLPWLSNEIRNFPNSPKILKIRGGKTPPPLEPYFFWPQILILAVKKPYSNSFGDFTSR